MASQPNLLDIVIPKQEKKITSIKQKATRTLSSPLLSPIYFAEY